MFQSCIYILIRLWDQSLGLEVEIDWILSGKSKSGSNTSEIDKKIIEKNSSGIKREYFNLSGRPESSSNTFWMWFNLWAHHIYYM